MTTSLTLEMGTLLHQPLVPDLLRFRPHQPKPRQENKREGAWFCLALAYYEVWDLVQALHTHVYAQWHIVEQQVLYSELDNRVIVSLILEICGVRMAGVGEECLGTDTQLDENAVTSAWAQAFRRACALFGLGLGVYFFPPLPSRYVAYDPKQKRISATPDTLSRLAHELYQKTPDPLLRGVVGVEGITLQELQKSVFKPFAPQDIEFLPKRGSRRQEPDGTWVCEANPYIEVWSLVRRLNAIAYGHWSVPRVEMALARNTIIVSVWLQIGRQEAPQPGVWQEPLTVNGQGSGVRAAKDVVTTAFSYAFKRACHLQGLALYLRALEPPVVTWDQKQIKQHALDLATALYQRHGLLHSPEQPSPASITDTPEEPLSRLDLLKAMLASDPKRISQICAHYRVSALDELSDSDLRDLEGRLHKMSQPGTATEGQMRSLRTLAAHFQEELPDQNTLSYNEARARIQDFEVRYQQERRATPVPAQATAAQRGGARHA